MPTPTQAFRIDLSVFRTGDFSAVMAVDFVLGFTTFTLRYFSNYETVIS